MTSLNNTLVQRALEYYDKNYELNIDFFNKINDIRIENKSDNDMDRNIIKFYDKNNKLLRKYKYEIIGIYKENQNLWQWAWANSELPKNLNFLSRKILNYGLDLDTKQTFLKTELITSTFKLSSDIQLDIHIAIASYLSKIPLIYELKNYFVKKKEHIYLFLIEDI